MARAFPFAICLSLLTAPSSFAQSPPPNDWFTRVAFSPAFVVANNPFASAGSPTDPSIGSAPSVAIEVGRQTDGRREWHRMYGLPSYGFGVSIASPGDSRGMSRPVDAYTFFSWPFAQPTERIQITSDFGMGLSWNWKVFDPQTNSYATVLGSNVNARIDWGFYLRYIVTPQTSLYAGVDYTHRSNGGMRQPDFGINVFGPSVALRYNLAPEYLDLPVPELPPFRPSWEFVAGGAGGRKNVAVDGNSDLRHSFGAFDATAAVQRHFYRFGKIAVGTDMTYDGSTEARVAGLGSAANRTTVQQRGALFDRLAMSVYGGYEHVIGRFGAIVQVGYKLANGSDEADSPRLYERYGWRYRLNNHYWSEFAIRSVKDQRADFLEFGAGYVTRWR
jgi:hypothetical protein